MLLGLYGGLIWIVLVIILSVAASKRGRSGFGWFLLNLFLSPLVGFMALVALPDPDASRKEERLEGSVKGSMNF